MSPLKPVASSNWRRAGRAGRRAARTRGQGSRVRAGGGGGGGRAGTAAYHAREAGDPRQVPAADAALATLAEKNVELTAKEEELSAKSDELEAKIDELMEARAQIEQLREAAVIASPLDFW